MLAHVPEAVAWHDGPDRAVRAPGALEAKNAETLTLANLVPVAGSRGRAVRPAKADVLVTGPPASATPGQAFVSLDSVLAELPTAEAADAGWLPVGRHDRVRMLAAIEHPVGAEPRSLDEAVAAVESGEVAQAVVRSREGTVLLRIVSMRARARQQRWGGEALLPTLELVCPGVVPLVAEVDVEAYLGGWG